MVEPPLKSKQNTKLTVVDALEKSFALFANEIAIDTHQAKLNYTELDELSFNLAVQIQQILPRESLKSRPIAIFMSRSVEFYVAEIAVLRAGGFFLPIDPHQPFDRVEFLLSDSTSSLFLVRNEDNFQVPATVDSLSVSANAQVMNSENQQSPLSDRNADADLGIVSDSDLAYMIYTSGSTGKPKGVAISHKSLLNFCDWWATNFEMSPSDRTMQFLSLGFDASLGEIFPALATGGTLVPLQTNSLESISRFLSFIKEQQVNVLHLPTAFWNALVASLAAQDTAERTWLPDCVKTVIFGGEKVDPGMVKKWFAHNDSDVCLVNVYGPTEATIACSCVVLTPGEQPSIGKPIAAVDFYVVTGDGDLAAEGQVGELYICGVCLAEGYWRQAMLSAEKFVACDFANQETCYRTGDLVRLRPDGNYEF